MKYSRPDYRFAAVICLIGLFIILAGSGVIPADPDSFNGPHWLVALCGLLIFLAGASVLASNYPRLRLSVIALLLAGFATVAVWMALFAAPEGWRGGILFLPQDINAWIARILVGSGILVLVYAFFDVVRRLIRGDAGRKTESNKRMPGDSA